MARIHNSDLHHEVQDGAKLQIVDKAPIELADKIVPVMEVNPKLLRYSTMLGRINNRTTTATGITVLAAQPNKDVVITGFYINYSQNAICDNTGTSLICYFRGVATELYQIRKQTTTAKDFNVYVNLSTPLLIDRNTAVTLTHIFAAGSSSIDVNLYGYFIDNPNA